MLTVLEYIVAFAAAAAIIKFIVLPAIRKGASGTGANSRPFNPDRDNRPQ